MGKIVVLITRESYHLCPASQLQGRKIGTIEHTPYLVNDEGLYYMVGEVFKKVVVAVYNAVNLLDREMIQYNLLTEKKLSWIFY